MRRLALFGVLTAMLVWSTGCDRTPNQPAATLPPAPTLAAPTDSALPSVAPTLPAATDTVSIPTTLPTTEPETAEPPTVSPETIQPTAETSPSPSLEPATSEPTAVSLFGPGQRTTATLDTAGSNAYLFQGTRYQPAILFVEPENELNVGLAAYVGDVTGQTTPEGLTPLASADNALAGRPEILVLSPEADGLFTFVLRAVSGLGNYTAHLFDLTTPAPGMVIQQPDNLAAAQEKTYNVTTRGMRPVIAIADPIDQSDIALDILGTDGALLTTANFSGPGGVETAYVLPLGITDYVVRVREVNGGPSAYNIAIISME